MRGFFNRIWQMMLESNLPGIIGAAIILLIGWLIALWLSRKAANSIKFFVDMRNRISGGERIEVPDSTGKFTGKVVYWLVIIIALLASMSLLKLEYAAVPLREFVTMIIAYLPNVAGALLLLFFARLLAGVVRKVVHEAMEKHEVRTHLARHFENDERAAWYCAQAAGFLVYLFFLPAILNILGIYGITEPLQEMFAVFLNYLPRLAGAAIIFFVGFWAAKVVRKAVSGAVVLSRIDALGKLCGFRETSPAAVAGVIGAVAWVMVAIPVIIAVLSTLDIALLSHPVSVFMTLLLAGAGNIIGALLIILFAIFAGRVAAVAVRKISAASGVDKWLEKAGFPPPVATRWPLSEVLGKITLICVVILGALGACDVLQLTGLAALIHRFAAFGGNLLLSVVVLFIGMALANFTVAMFGEKLGKNWSCALKAVVVIFTLAMALSNLNVGHAVVEIAFGMLLGAFCVAFALAFGLGGREFAAKWLEAWKRPRE